jgi:hypothetical protein
VVVDLVLLFLLWCFLLCVEDLAGAVALVLEAGGSAANTGPAIRARAMTGTSFLNIDVVSKGKRMRSFTLVGA